MVYTISGIRFPTVPLNKSAGSNFHVDRKITRLSFGPFSYGKILHGRSSESSSFTVAASEKILVPGSSPSDGSSSAEQIDVAEAGLEDSEVSGALDGSDMVIPSQNEDEEISDEPTGSYALGDIEQDSASLEYVNADDVASAVGTSDTLEEKISDESDRIKKKVIPPSGLGQRIYEIDPMLNNYRGHLDYRYDHYKKMRDTIDKYEGGLEAFSRGYEKLGFTRSATGITYREWAPGAKSYLAASIIQM